MRRRTDFEHRIASRAAKPKDFLRYAEYEMNADRLRLKRVKRLGAGDFSDDENETSVKGHGVSAYAGQRRILFIFERGVRRFTGDMSLWANYIQYAKQEKTLNVLTKIYTRMLQLHPTKPAVWIMAAKYEVEQNSAIRAARSIMQRGLRFNSTSEIMWIEYAKLELIYVCKILARRKLLGLVTEAQQKAQEEAEKRETPQDKATTEDDAATGADTIVLPNVDADLEAEAKAELKALPDADMSMLGNPETNPALRGDIALAIYDAAVPSLTQYTTRDSEKQEKILSISQQFLSLFDSFTEGVDPQYLCGHVVSSLIRTFPPPLAPQIAFMDITLPIRHLAHSNPNFPDCLKLVINKYNQYIKNTYGRLQPQRLELASELKEYLKGRFANVEDMEPNVALVLKALRAKCESQN